MPARQVSATLFDVLLADETNIPLTLRMQMVRDVGGETMSGALKEAIEPRLAKIHNNDAKTAAGTLDALNALDTIPRPLLSDVSPACGSIFFFCV
jgi:hypothetical protein